MRIEDLLSETYQELLEQSSCIATLFLHPKLIDKYDSYYLLQIRYLHKGLIAVLEELSAADLHMQLFSVLILGQVSLYGLLEQSGPDLERYAFWHVPDDLPDFGRERRG